MGWLTSYSSTAELSDRFHEHENHLLLLAAGLLGEAGSIVAEIKKKERETSAYPAYRQRLTEELGDFLWYYVRLVALSDARLLDGLETAPLAQPTTSTQIGAGLDLGSSVGEVLCLVQEKKPTELKASLRLIWNKLETVASIADIKLEDAARLNLKKTQSRWPRKKEFHDLFDENCPAEEQIPRQLTIEFLERQRGSRIEVLLRAHGINVGDRVTDNILDPDGYRYHDIFHIAYAVFLGWSPVVRALLRCKRKSSSATDENQDGARAQILEEAVSAIVFSRAKNMEFFEGASQVDYDLLKHIQEFIAGYEAARVPVWQWEMAILEGYRMFRLLRSGLGGRVSWDLKTRTLEWTPIIDSQNVRAI